VGFDFNCLNLSLVIGNYP